WIPSIINFNQFGFTLFHLHFSSNEKRHLVATVIVSSISPIDFNIHKYSIFFRVNFHTFNLNIELFKLQLLAYIEFLFDSFRFFLFYLLFLLFFLNFFSLFIFSLHFIILLFFLLVFLALLIRFINI